MRRARRRGRSVDGAADVDVTPLMNLFVAMIPMLLLSAVFVSLASIDLSLPAASEVPQQRSDFMLALRIVPGEWRVEARGASAVRLEPGDTAGLLQALEALHAAHPEHRSVLVACAPQVGYEEVIHVLDVAALAGFVDCALAGVNAEPGAAPPADAPPASNGGAS